MPIYAMDVDARGNVYAYQNITGTIYQIAPDGQITTVAQLPVAAIDTKLAVGPTGDIYVGYSGFTNDGPGEPPKGLMTLTLTKDNARILLTRADYHATSKFTNTDVSRHWLGGE